jgi:hypothetical protein
MSLYRPGRLRVANLLYLLQLPASSFYERLADGRIPAPDWRDGRHPEWSTATVRKLLAVKRYR